MSFTADIAIPDWALTDFKNFYNLLITKHPLKNGQIDRLYLHWSVGHYSTEFSDYNFQIILKNNKWVIDITGNPEDNVPGLNNNTIHSHTWRRNSNALGICVSGMYNGNIHNFGPEPVTTNEIMYLCGAAAAACKAYNIDASGKVIQGTNHLDNDGNNLNTLGEFNILSHAECAIIDKYPSERIDLGSLEPLPIGVDLTPAIRTQSGNILRSVIHRIKSML